MCPARTGSSDCPLPPLTLPNKSPQTRLLLFFCTMKNRHEGFLSIPVVPDEQDSGAVVLRSTQQPNRSQTPKALQHPAPTPCPDTPTLRQPGCTPAHRGGWFTGGRSVGSCGWHFDACCSLLRSGVVGLQPVLIHRHTLV